MKKTNKKTKSIVIVLVVILVLYLVYRYWKNKQDYTTNSSSSVINSSTNSISSGSTPTAQACTNTTVLKRGMKNCDRIQWSQYEINKVYSKLGIAKLTQDGIFGPKTEAAFQKLLGKSTGSYAEVFNKVKSIN